MKRMIAAAAVVLAALGAIVTRTMFEGRGALADGDALATRGDVRGAIAAWETAARWYLPGASHVDTAYEHLRGVADHDPAHALAAWRAIRGAALATRSWWTPHAEDLAAADAKIAELSADDPERSPALGEDRAARLAWHQAQLARDDRPGTAAALLAIGGICCFLGGMGLLVLRGIDPAGKVVRRPALAGAAIATLGAAGWLVGL